MRQFSFAAALALDLALAAAAAFAAGPADALAPMPAALETEFALSAAPPALRARASVYLLDPSAGYRLSRAGTSGVACLVERTVWEMAEFRDDVFIPLCYDAAGAKAHLRVILDTAALRARGMSAAAVKAEVLARYARNEYRAPERAGVSYMVAPVMRAPGPPDLKVHTLAMPHLMFYAPGVTNEDLGAVPDLARHETLLYPFIDRQGIAEQSYIIQMLGEAETTRSLADSKELLGALCAFDARLCLPPRNHGGH